MYNDIMSILKWNILDTFILYIRGTEEETKSLRGKGLGKARIFLAS